MNVVSYPLLRVVDHDLDICEIYITIQINSFHLGNPSKSLKKIRLATIIRECPVFCCIASNTSLEIIGKSREYAYDWKCTEIKQNKREGVYEGIDYRENWR